MGFRICYIACRIDPQKLAEALGFSAGRKVSEMPDGEWWVARLHKSGWTLFWSEEEAFGQNARDLIEKLAQSSDVYLCEVNETVMWSSAEFWKDGQSVWKVTHRGDGDGIYNLPTEGTLPDNFSQIRQTCFDNQQNEDSVDYIFEIPLELAASDVGFRHEHYLEESDVDGFYLVNPAKKKGLLSRLFGN